MTTQWITKGVTIVTRAREKSYLTRLLSTIFTVISYLTRLISTISTVISYLTRLIATIFTVIPYQTCLISTIFTVIFAAGFVSKISCAIGL